MLTYFSSTQYNFEGKKSGEAVAILLHRHWFTIAARMMIVVIMFILPLILFPFINAMISKYIPIGGLTFLLYTIYFMIVWSFFMYSVTMYLLDSWIVTNERIISNTQHGFFNRTVSEMELSRVQDVTVSVDGIIETTMNFGNLEIQTAGKEEKFVFEQIPNPQRVKDTVMKVVSGMNDGPANQYPV